MHVNLSFIFLSEDVLRQDETSLILNICLKNVFWFMAFFQALSWTRKKCEKQLFFQYINPHFPGLNKTYLNQCFNDVKIKIVRNRFKTKTI